MRRGLTFATLCLLALAFGLEARGEVRVTTDRRGQYRRTQVITSGDPWNPKIWSVTSASMARRGTQALVLNPNGDRTGDLWPALQESNETGYPWVVWSRLNRGGYDLVWSRWDKRGWQPVGWLRGEDDENALGDDLDPDVTFDRGGRPHLVWWREEGGRGRVYLSIWLHSDWMKAYAVSDLGLDARYPTVETLGTSTIRVEYDTDDGPVTQLIQFDRPVTITDDLDPVGHLSLVDQMPEEVQYQQDDP